MENTEIILSGPEYTGEDFIGSIAEFLIPRVKALPKDRIAQVDAKTNESITSHEFLKLSIEVGEGLINLGLKEGDVVVISCPNSIRCHVAAIGVILSGGVCTGVDGNLKPLESQLLIKQFQPKFIICESEKAKKYQESCRSVNLDPKIITLNSSNSNGEFLTWDDLRTEVDVDNYTPRPVTNPKKDLALISCSSGSTGLPKGVGLSHYSLISNHLLMEAMSKDVDQNNILLISPLFWISGLLFILQSFICGSTRYVPKSSDPQDLLEGIQKCKPFFIFLSPSSLHELVAHPNFKNYDVSSIKLIISGGASLGASLIQKIKALWNGVFITQMYGLTESCGSVTTVGDRENSVGKLAPDVKMKVVDQTTGKSLGPNTVGECRLKTKRIMVGYYNNEEDTKATFDEDGWFRTGDLVYYDEEGFIFVVGRIKESIKYQSYQVSPVELESYIIGLPGVKDVAVVGIPHQVDGNHLRALVVKDPKSDITPEIIIEGVKENFSNQKQLRAGVQFVDALPRSEVGKLKRPQVQKMVI